MKKKEYKIKKEDIINLIKFYKEFIKEDIINPKKEITINEGNKSK